MTKPLPAQAGWDDIWPTVGETGLAQHNTPVRFRIAPRGFTFEVFRNACFWGVFCSEGEAHACVHDEMQRIFTGGGAAQLRCG